MYPGIGEEGLDLLNKMLVFNPYFRPTVEECLDHPYFTNIRTISKEVTAGQEVFLDLEREGELNLLKLRELFIKEVEIYKRLREEK